MIYERLLSTKCFPFSTIVDQWLMLLITGIFPMHNAFPARPASTRYELIWYDEIMEVLPIKNKLNLIKNEKSVIAPTSFPIGMHGTICNILKAVIMILPYSSAREVWCLYLSYQQASHVRFYLPPPPTPARHLVPQTTGSCVRIRIQGKTCIMYACNFLPYHPPLISPIWGTSHHLCLWVDSPGSIRPKTLQVYYIH